MIAARHRRLRIGEFRSASKPVSVKRPISSWPSHLSLKKADRR